jgi:transposase
MTQQDDERFAREGTIWVCAACGKTAKDRYGDGTSSWDESCMLNSVLCHAEKMPDENGRLLWTAVIQNNSEAASK